MFEFKPNKKDCVDNLCIKIYYVTFIPKKQNNTKHSQSNRLVISCTHHHTRHHHLHNIAWCEHIFCLFHQLRDVDLSTFFLSQKMGNSFGCSASGERLVSAARDGDLVEAKMLLSCNPCLAKYSTFGGLNSPLHFAAAKGHNEVFTIHIYNIISLFFFLSKFVYLFVFL